jgi:transposase
MARAYSNDLRERVAEAVVGGLSCRRVAKLFRISPSSVVKWSERYRQTGSAAAKPMGGVRRAVLADHRGWLLARIKQKPDLTLQAVRTELAERGVIVSLWAVWKFYRSEKITFKKTGLDRRPACSGRNGPRYCGAEGSGRTLFGGSVPVKKRGPWAVADLQVVTLSGDPD